MSCGMATTVTGLPIADCPSSDMMQGTLISGHANTRVDGRYSDGMRWSKVRPLPRESYVR